MLTFKRITWRNFLSTGNVENTIELNKHSSTLITGKNGEGKSTLLCAITFALFGKPFRNVNKAQLINSINKKNCLVTVEFEVNGHSYVVKRGIKPNVFDILCDGQLINQDAALKDYQKVLEQQILKLNYKTFTQVVILGSATYVPFMQLTSAQRREVIEDILDIRVFSVMNNILKDRASIIRNSIADVEAKITNQKLKINAQKKLIETLETNRKTVVDSLKQKMEANNEQIRNARSTIASLSKQIAHMSDIVSKKQELESAIQKAVRMRVKESTNISSCQDTLEFFHNNETCPTCSQHIPEEHKNAALQEIDAKIATHQTKLDELVSVAKKLDTQLENSRKTLNELTEKSIEIGMLNTTISILEDQNKELDKEVAQVHGDSVNLTAEKQKMKQYAEEAIEAVTAKTTLLEERHLHDVASALLKDTGIKTAIIREYLPVMNKLINRYLSAMDFFVKFELDESFQEVIRSRDRDVFTYDSFSEGEKRRIDLAILFTWRQIAKMKNSVNTNIMILDEILDGALDAGGIDYFLSIMNQFGENTSVFVISHRDVADKFDNVIRVEKRADFSVLA